MVVVVVGRPSSEALLPLPWWWKAGLGGGGGEQHRKTRGGPARLHPQGRAPMRRPGGRDALSTCGRDNWMKTLFFFFLNADLSVF